MGGGGRGGGGYCHPENNEKPKAVNLEFRVLGFRV